MKRGVGFILFLVTVGLVLDGCARVPKPLGGPGAVPPPSTAYGVYHIVSRGETLYRVSKQYDVDIGELMRVNHIGSPSSLTAGQRLYIPRAHPAPGILPVPFRAVVPQDVRELVGPRHPTSDWRTITVHHSGTSQGSARLFDRDHRRRRMGGLFYHFVIGNGTNTSDGRIEVGWRWKKQVKANRPRDIQICLVGNFDEEYVSDAQFKSLVDLINVLREEYSIPLSGIRRHCDIRGKHTDCPGKNFPFERLIARLSDASFSGR